MYLYVYDKLNKEFMKTEVELEKETSKMFYIKDSEYYNRLGDIARQAGDIGLYNSFNKAVRKDCLPVVSMGAWYRGQARGAMFVLSENELSLEEVKNLLNREVNFSIRQQEKTVQEAIETLSALHQISAEVSGLEEITDLDNEEGERNR